MYRHPCACVPLCMCVCAFVNVCVCVQVTVCVYESVCVYACVCVLCALGSTNYSKLERDGLKRTWNLISGETSN